MINANLDLNAQTEALFLNLEKETGLSKDQLISTAVNNSFKEEVTEEMDDLVMLALMTDLKKNNPNAKTYSHEEVGAMLGFI